MLSFCGVGNPFSITTIRQTSTVLDIGCGSGIDLVIAGMCVGERGHAVGIDITPAMVDKAKTLINELTIKNCEAILIDSDKLPFTENSFDTVISNGVINLSLNKPNLFQEIFRVLKPSGQLQFADIVIEKKLPAQRQSAQDWSD